MQAVACHSTIESKAGSLTIRWFFCRKRGLQSVRICRNLVHSHAGNVGSSAYLCLICEVLEHAAPHIGLVATSADGWGSGAGLDAHTGHPPHVALVVDEVERQQHILPRPHQQQGDRGGIASSPSPCACANLRARALLRLQTAGRVSVATAHSLACSTALR